MSDKPMPRLTAINRPFFEACNRDEIFLQQCDNPDCRRFVYFPRVCCPYCHGGHLTWRLASGRGKIVTFTRIHRPQHKSFFDEAPYYFIAVELEEGPLMYSRLEEKSVAEIGLLGHSVEVVFVDHTPQQKLPFFRLSVS
jgi:uncharacterized protein